jgi:hypothetical protein
MDDSPIPERSILCNEKGINTITVADISAFVIVFFCLY